MTSRPRASDITRAAAQVVREQDARAALKKILAAKVKRDRLQEQARRASVAYDAAVATACSSQPTRPDYWAHPGKLEIPSLVSELRLSTATVASIMKRYAARKNGDRR